MEQEEIKWYDVIDTENNNVPPELAKVAMRGNELFMPMEAFGLKLADIVTMIFELDGNVLLGVKKENGLSGVWVSLDMIRNGLIVKHKATQKLNGSLEAFDQTIEGIRSKINGND